MDSHEFKGWAIVELMGRQQCSGFVESVSFGGVVMFRVFADEVASSDHTAEQRIYYGGQSIPAGAKYRTSRPRFEKYVGLQSVYALTPCTQEEATRSLPVKLEILELPVAALSPAGDDSKSDVMFSFELDHDIEGEEQEDDNDRGLE